MKIPLSAFNIYLCLLLVPLALLQTSCKTTEQKKKDKEASTLRFHLEVNRDGTPYNSTVPVYRANPIQVSASRDAFLDEGYIEEASVVDVDKMGGFGIRIQFDPHGRLVLENVTTSNKGQRIVIFSSFGQVRWLAAPVITHRISDGVFVFTPDATREEAGRIVLGLNNVIKAIKKQSAFFPR
ncbi:MAG: Preprotein translocase subunit SecD [Verrucomicrobiales bacterium]|jgi:hypothetical protein|nr:Preprotein translocase subunit SecD [Verrucomicrobiales bacterium]